MSSKTTQNDLLKAGERAVVIEINGSIEFQQYLLANGISLGSILTKNYSPNYAKLVNLTIGGKMLSIRRSDFNQLVTIKL